jgi:aldehyde:ferredoxin oxidoreductase
MNGYMGKILRVNLTTGAVATAELDAQMARDFIGGTGLGVRLAYDEIAPDCDPFGPDNKVIIATGPMTATPLATASRFQVVFKSPLTNILCDASSGGFWGVDLKKAGFDVLIIEGAAEKPVYLWINDGNVEVRDAAQVWGHDCFETQALLKAEVEEPKARVMCIGRGGELKSLHGCLLNGEARTPGRGGGGAVFGAKNLKAIVVRGTQPFPVADEEELKLQCRKLIKGEIHGHNVGMEPYEKHGTAAWLKASWAIGDVPVRNWQVGEWKEGCLSLCGPHMSETILTKRSACYRCPMACGRMVKVTDGPFAFEGPGPEYETLAALGTNTMVGDLEAVAYAGHLCNVYGIDTISTGATIAWAMECFEKGLLTTDDTDGIELTFGSAEAMVAAVEKAGKVEGKLGRLLAMGVKRAAEQVGGDSADFACHSKGMETAMHDPRAFSSMYATYAAGPRGACHLHGQSMNYEAENALPEWGLKDFNPDEKTKGKGRIADVARAHFLIFDSMVICAFLPGGYPMTADDLALFLNLSTGAGYTGEELHTIGRRISTLHRAYNNRCGITRADDTLSKRQLSAVKEGAAKDYKPDFEGIMHDHYASAGWDENGRPTPETLEALGLGFVAKDIHA